MRCHSYLVSQKSNRRANELGSPMERSATAARATCCAVTMSGSGGAWLLLNALPPLMPHCPIDMRERIGDLTSAASTRWRPPWSGGLALLVVLAGLLWSMRALARQAQMARSRSSLSPSPAGMIVSVVICCVVAAGQVAVAAGQRGAVGHGLAVGAGEGETRRCGRG